MLEHGVVKYHEAFLHDNLVTPHSIELHHVLPDTICQEVHVYHVDEIINQYVYQEKVVLPV